jgi:hypothetical protein
VSFICGGAYQGGRPAAKPACGTPRAERSADASFPSTYKGAARPKPWLASPRTRTRPCGFSRQGRGKRLRRRASGASQARGLRDLRRRLILSSPTGAPAYAESINNNNQTIPVAAGKPVGTSFKMQQFSGFAPEVLCLPVVPTVGITAGTPVGTFVGRPVRIRDSGKAPAFNPFPSFSPSISPC